MTAPVIYSPYLATLVEKKIGMIKISQISFSKNNFENIALHSYHPLWVPCIKWKSKDQAAQDTSFPLLFIAMS